MSHCLPAISAWSFCCKAGVPIVAGVPTSVLLCCMSLSSLQSLHGVSVLKLESLLSLEPLQVSFSAVTVFPPISAWRFCFKVGVPAGVFLCCHCLAISAGSSCCKPGVPNVAGVLAGVFLCFHCLTCNLCGEFML
jgi:hypothetical protein